MHWLPNFSAARRDHLRRRDRRGVEAHLVGAREQQRAHVLGRPHAAAHGQRHEALLRGAARRGRAACRGSPGSPRCRGSRARRRPPRRRRAPPRPDRRRRRRSTKFTPLTTRPSLTSRQGMTRTLSIRPPARVTAAAPARDQRRAADAVDDAQRARAGGEPAGAGAEERVAEGIGEGERDEGRLEDRHLRPERPARIEELRQEGDEEDDRLRVQRRDQPGVRQHPHRRAPRRCGPWRRACRRRARA